MASGAARRALSERVSRNVPHRRDPERLHIEKSCIRQDLELARSIIWNIPTIGIVMIVAALWLK
jgi:hypothetical protein